MARLRKKEAYDLLRNLEMETLKEISKSSKHVNFQRGSKTALKKAIREAQSQSDIETLKSYMQELTNYQQVGISGMIEMYLDHKNFRIARFYAKQYGLSDEKTLQLFEQYESTLLAIENSGDIEKLIQEFILEDFELGNYEDYE